MKTSSWFTRAALVCVAALLALAVVAPALAAGPLTIRYISQYTGLTTQNVDCGPAAVAMILDAYGKRPAGWTDKQFVADIRAKTGGTGTTGFAQLERAIAAYGMSFAEVPNTATPQPDAQMQLMKAALGRGQPVIALLHGATLGRGTAYGDHWVVVRGFSDDGQTVWLNDPDNQPARTAAWIAGGQIALPYATFRLAAYQAAPGPYGIIVGAGLVSGPPATPNGLAVVGVGTNALTLGWQAVAGASGYRIYRWSFAENRWDFFPLATTAGTNYTQGGLVCGDSFNYYLVTAYNAVGESPRSGWVQGTTQACAAPATPSGLAVVGVGPNALTLGWQAVAGASGYRIYRWAFAENRWDFFPLATTAGTNYTQGGLPCGNTFNYYLVTAYNPMGESPRSGWVQGTTRACTSAQPRVPAARGDDLQAQPAQPAPPAAPTQAAPAPQP